MFTKPANPQPATSPTPGHRDAYRPKAALARAAAASHKTGMTSGELLDRVQAKRAEVERYVEVNSRRRRLLVNLVVIAGAFAALLTAPAAVGGKRFTDWLQDVFNSPAPAWQFLCLFASLSSVACVIATQIQKSSNYEEHIVRAQELRATLEVLEISISSESLTTREATGEFLKCLESGSFMQPTHVKG